MSLSNRSKIVPRSTLLRYAVGALGTTGFTTLPGLVLLYFMTNTLGVAALAAGVMITAARVWDVLVSPIIGSWSDHSALNTGSRRRLLVIGVICAPTLFVVTFTVPGGLSGMSAAAWVTTAFLVATTAFIAYQVPYAALPAEITTDYDQRTRLVSGRIVVTMIAILLFGAVAPALRALGGDDARAGYAIMAVICAAVIAIALAVGATAAPRRSAVVTPRPSVRAVTTAGRAVLARSASFRALLLAFVLLALAASTLLAGAQYLATFVLGWEGAINLLFAALIVPAVVATPVWAVVARRIGKERSFVWAGIAFGGGCLALTGMLIEPGPWIFAAMVLCGVGYAGVQSLPISMLADVIAHDGRDEGGAFSGVWTAGEALGASFGVGVFAVVLALSGFVSSSVGGVAQTDQAVAGIVLGNSLLPCALAVIALLVFRGYRLRRTDIADDSLLVAVVS